MKRRPITQHFLISRERPVTDVALRFKRHKTWLDLNWPEYYRRAEAVALGLAALGIKNGDRVAVLSNTRWEWAALDFGIMGLGAVTIPIYQSNRADETEFILKNATPRVLFVEDMVQLHKWESIAKRSAGSVEHVVCIQPDEDFHPSPTVHGWDDFLNKGIAEYAKQPDFFEKQIGKTKLENLATVVYTSGTTGDPKGVMLTHEQILSEMEGLLKAYPISSQDSTLSFLPYAHVLGRAEIWLHAYVGFTLNFAESVDKMKNGLRETKPTVIIGVPRIFEKIFAGILTELQSNPIRKNAFHWLEGDTASLLSGLMQWPRQIMMDLLIYSRLREGLGGRLRFSVSGGAPLEPRIAEFFRKAGILVLEGYGLTETTAAVTVNTPDDFEFGTVGRPLSGVDIKMASDGEILVKGGMIFTGYYGEPAATEAAFENGYFRTGDIGEWTKEGLLRITDRKKDLIKTAGGKYVAPQKIESLFKLDPLISHALIHGDRKKYIVALITLNEPFVKRLAVEQKWKYRDFKSQAQSREIQDRVRKIVAQINSQLSSFETVKNFAILNEDFTIENGELTPSLKVKRRVLDERYKDLIESLY